MSMINLMIISHSADTIFLQVSAFKIKLTKTLLSKMINLKVSVRNSSCFLFKNSTLYTDQRIVREFEDLKRSKYYPSQNYRFPVSNEPLVSGFIVNPEQISPLLKTSEERIKALEKEVKQQLENKI